MNTTPNSIHIKKKNYKRDILLQHDEENIKTIFNPYLNTPPEQLEEKDLDQKEQGSVPLSDISAENSMETVFVNKEKQNLIASDNISSEPNPTENSFEHPNIGMYSTEEGLDVTVIPETSTTQNFDENVTQDHYSTTDSKEFLLERTPSSNNSIPKKIDTSLNIESTDPSALENPKLPPKLLHKIKIENAQQLHSQPFLASSNIEYSPNDFSHMHSLSLDSIFQKESNLGDSGPKKNTYSIQPLGEIGNTTATQLPLDTSEGVLGSVTAVEDTSNYTLPPGDTSLRSMKLYKTLTSHSTNVDNELNFLKGDIISLLYIKDGKSYGQLGNNTGFFDTNLCCELNNEPIKVESFLKISETIDMEKITRNEAMYIMNALKDEEENITKNVEEIREEIFNLITIKKEFTNKTILEYINNNEQIPLLLYSIGIKDQICFCLKSVAYSCMEMICHQSQMLPSLNNLLPQMKILLDELKTLITKKKKLNYTRLEMNLRDLQNLFKEEISSLHPKEITNTIDLILLMCDMIESGEFKAESI